MHHCFVHFNKNIIYLRTDLFDPDQIFNQIEFLDIPLRSFVFKYTYHTFTTFLQRQDQTF